mgnify:CR=1 FL=1
MPAAAKPERILVLCVDRDDDIGMKAGINTPILGRKENVNAAASLALRDPEEADANTMFEAVRIYDNLKKSAKGQEEHEVATIAGSDLAGVEADRQLVSELTDVLKEFQATDVILVTDGYTDEMVLPLIESRVPVTSVRRIVVKHSKSIEETAAVFSRYMKILVENPRYSRMVLGLPGILLVVLGLLWYANQLTYAVQALVIIMGVFLVLRGFRIDKMARSFYQWIKEYSPPPFTVQIVNFSALAGILLIIVGGYLGGTAVANVVTTVVNPLAHIPRFIGEFLHGAVEADDAHQKYVETKQQAQKLHQQCVELLEKIRTIKRDLKKKADKEQTKRQSEIQKELEKRALAKLKRGEKLLWEEFQILAEKGML